MKVKYRHDPLDSPHSSKPSKSKKRDKCKDNQYVDEKLSMVILNQASAQLAEDDPVTTTHDDQIYCSFVRSLFFC